MLIETDGTGFKLFLFEIFYWSTLKQFIKIPIFSKQVARTFTIILIQKI